MKKKISLLLCTPLVLTLISCAPQDSSYTSDVDDSSVTDTDDETEQTAATLVDVYEDSRPNYSDMFDYESEYVPEELPDFDADITLTLSDDSPITFADGSRTFVSKPGQKLSLSDFDTDSIEDGRTLLGVAEVDENGIIGNGATLANYSVPYEDVTIIPYFSAKEGFTALTLGSGANGRFNWDGISGSFSSSTLSYTSSTIVGGGNGGYAEMGATFTQTSRITANSPFRLDSTTSIITETAVYEYSFNFENKGTEDVHLSVYHISSSSEYKNGSNAYSQRYRVDVDLAPGESMSTTGQYLLDSNSNALTYVLADENMNSMVLGMTLAIRKTDLDEPETENDVEYADITLDLPTGIALKENSGYETRGVVGQNIVPPTDDQLNNTTGRTIDRWFAYGDTHEYADETRLRSGGNTIAPIFAASVGQDLIPGGAYDKADYYYNLNSPSVNKDEASITVSKYFVNNEYGSRVQRSDSMVTNDFFRLLTYSGASGESDGIEANKNYKFTYRVTNMNSESVKFYLIQIPQKTNIEESQGAVISNSYTLTSNQTATITINSFTAPSNNQNIMTGIVIEESISSLDLQLKVNKLNLS